MSPCVTGDDGRPGIRVYLRGVGSKRSVCNYVLDLYPLQDN